MTALRYLHLTGKRFLVVLVLAALAAAVFATYQARKPVRYQAQTTVFVTRVFPSDPSAIDSAVDDFETVIGLPQVRRAVAASSGTSVGALASGLKFHRIGTSSAEQVTFRAPNAAVASNVVLTASHEALTTLAQQQLDGAREAVAAAQPVANSALSALVAFQRDLGVTDFTAEYQAHQQALLNLENQLATASPGRIAALNGQILSETAAVNRLAAAQPQYQQLQNALSQDNATLDSASKALIDAQARVAAASSSTTVTAPTVSTASRLLPVVRAGVIAAVIVVLLGIGLYSLVDRAGARDDEQLPAGTPERVSGPVDDTEDRDAERGAPVV